MRYHMVLFSTQDETIAGGETSAALMNDLGSENTLTCENTSFRVTLAGPAKVQRLSSPLSRASFTCHSITRHQKWRVVPSIMAAGGSAPLLTDKDAC